MVHLVTFQRIYDERFPNDYIEICPDAETGEHVEIRAVTLVHGVPEITNRVALSPESIPLVIQALNSFRKV